MNQITTMLPMPNVNYNEYIKINYANYQPVSVTQNANALIDILNGTILLTQDDISVDSVLIP